MNGYILSPAAQVDVDEIWDFTAAQWSEDQAVRYIQGIRDACAGLTAGSIRSRPVEVRRGYRKATVGSHAIYFRIADEGQIVIVRILHQRMDVQRHLK